MHAAGDESSPAGLVAGTEAGAVIAMEVLIKQDEITPVRVVLKLPGSAIDRTPALLIAQEDAGQPPRDFLGDLIEVHAPSGSCRTFHGKVIAVVGVIVQQGADDQAVDRHPDGSPPIRVAAKHAG